MTPRLRPFDDRVRRTDAGDGSDFQTFVVDALASDEFAKLLEGRYVEPHFAISKDGAIDHLAYSDTDRIIIECKFVGKERKNGPRREWSRVAKTLGANLRKLAHSGSGGIPAIYAPWFDTACPVKSYWFCTTALPPHAGDQDDLRKRIRTFFETLAACHPMLAHLKQIDVRVFAWNNFESAMSPQLRYSWFGGYPTGLEPLHRDADQRTFRRFLSHESLPYFSRSAFNLARSLPADRSMEDETSILQRTTGDDSLGLLIYGAGGLGKTRLALELAHALSDDWLVLRVTANARAESIQKLAAEYTSPARVLFIIDYAEAAKNLPDVIEAVQAVNAQGGHRFRFVATCRSGALRAVQDVLEYIAYERVDLSHPGHREYAEWALREILKFGSVPNPETIALSCRSTPVLAAWAVYLLQLDPARFDAQFAGLNKGDDLTGWARKRLRVAVEAKRLQYELSERALAEIAIMLPLSSQEYDQLRDAGQYGPLLDILRADHWIELDEGAYVAAHDIFADAILALYVLVDPAATIATDRVYDVLLSAGRYRNLERAIIALDRLKERSGFDAIRGSDVVIRLMDAVREAVLSSHVTLLSRRFLGERGAITILGRIPDLRDAVLSDARCDLTLSLLSANAAKSVDELWRAEAADILYPLLDCAIDRSPESNIVLCRALVLCPQRYESVAFSWIWNSDERRDSHFLIVAWLRARLPIARIAERVKTWLEANATRDDADFVYRSWLNAKGDVDAIADLFFKWLALHGRRYSATFVYRAWLEAGGSVEKIEPFVTAWLEAHWLSEDATYLYGSWLSANGSPGTVEGQLRTWFATYGETAAASHVLAPWLEKTSDRDVVEPLAIRWLDSYGMMDSARYVFRGWLAHPQQPVNLAMIEPFVKTWLEAFGDTPSGAFVFAPWLRARGAVKTIQSHLLRWLAKYGQTYEASYSLHAWLEAGASRRIAQPFVVAWLSVYATSERARHIYRGWLTKGGDVAAVAEFIHAWADVHDDSPEAYLVYSCCVRARGADVLAPRVLHWLARHGTSDNAKHVIRNWLESAGDVAVIEPYITNWLAAHRSESEASFVYAPWLRSCPDLAALEPEILCWLDAFGTAYAAGQVYQSWLDVGADRRTITRYVESWLGLHGTSWDARFVYLSWLYAFTDVGSVGPYVAMWLEHYSTVDTAWLVLRAFESRGGDLRLFSESLSRCFEQARERGDEEAAFLRLAGKPGLSASDVRALVDWCTELANATTAMTALNRLLDFNAKGGDRKIIITDALLHVLPRAAVVPVRDALLRAALLHGIGSLAYISRSRPEIRDVIDQIHATLIRDPGFHQIVVESEAPAVQSGEIVDHVADMVARGVLDPERDIAGLTSFAGWLSSWPAARKPKFSAGAQELRELMPGSTLWEVPDADG